MGMCKEAKDSWRVDGKRKETKRNIAERWEGGVHPMKQENKQAQAAISHVEFKLDPKHIFHGCMGLWGPVKGLYECLLLHQ